MANHQYEHKKLGFWEAYSIGVGGMIGGGIFAVLGLTILLAQGAAPIAFFLAGLIALITAYSYVKLSVRYPSEGGTVEFLVRGFGTGLFTGWLNTLLLASYMVMLALYAYAFGSYGAVLISGEEILWLKKALIVGVIAFFTLLNVLGAYVSGKVEDLMVLLKVLILLFFTLLGFMTADASRLSPENWAPLLRILTGGLIIFLAYEGFELIANTARDVENPQKILPRAFYASVVSVMVIYVAVAAVAVGNLTYEQVEQAKDYALAVAAEPFLGQLGFVLIGIAALFSTASAINATLYGSARVSYMVARFGQLPQQFARRVWKNAYEGLFIIALLTILAATTFNLENISNAGSLGFLLVFGAVNGANFKLARYTDANRWIALGGCVACIASALVLVGYNLETQPESLISSAILVGGSLLFEGLYRIITHRKIAEYIDWRLHHQETFMRSYEEVLPRLLEEIKKRFADAEVYLTGHLARGEREKASSVQLEVYTSEKLAAHQRKEEAERIRQQAELAPYDPVYIEIHHTSEKRPEKAHQVL